jgi:glycogen debranching enzyme-like protein
LASAMPEAAGGPRSTVLESPLVRFGREICGDLPSALRREWLVTNGLGGYASGTLAGINTRRYHGVLVAALTPPVGRTVLVGGLVEWAFYDGGRYPLSTHEYGDRTIDPHGYKHQQTFTLEGMLPVWHYALGDAVLEKRVWMAYGAKSEAGLEMPLRVRNAQVIVLGLDRRSSGRTSFNSNRLTELIGVPPSREAAIVGNLHNTLDTAGKASNAVYNSGESR